MTNLVPFTIFRDVLCHKRKRRTFLVASIIRGWALVFLEFFPTTFVIIFSNFQLLRYLIIVPTKMTLTFYVSHPKEFNFIFHTT